MKDTHDDALRHTYEDEIARLERIIKNLEFELRVQLAHLNRNTVEQIIHAVKNKA